MKMNKEMNLKPWKHNLFILLAVLTVLSLLLSACGPVVNLHGKANSAKDKNKANVSENDTEANKITICHKTRSAQNPYVEITVSANGAKNGHAKHAGDIIPAPKDGCPSTSSSTTDNKDNENETDDGANMITICHKTGSAKHPYVEISLSKNVV